MSKDIYIPDPFGLSIELLETEEQHLPSFRCEFSVRFETKNSQMFYSATDTWIEDSTFDGFLSNLKKLAAGEETIAELFDMSHEIIYKVSLEQISVIIARTMGVTSTGHLEFQCDADHDQIIIHKDHIEKFPKWW